jgi:hypothetical protein
MKKYEKNKRAMEGTILYVEIGILHIGQLTLKIGVLTKKILVFYLKKGLG